MRKRFLQLTGVAVALILASCGHCNKESEGCSKDGHATHEAANHVAITNSAEALAELKAGNARFVEGKLINTNYKQQVEATKEQQHPHTFVLSCMDSRVPPEIVFDQGIGNIFVTRDAGNVEDSTIIGSLEYAVAVKHVKLVVVMGHSGCGAVHGAIDNVKLGHLTQLLEQIKPAVDTSGATKEDDVTLTVKKNTEITKADILAGSSIVKEAVDKGELKIVTAFYDLATGAVAFTE